MSFVVTHPFYGPPVYHHITCPAIRRWFKGGEQAMLLPPADAVPCKRCGGREFVKTELAPVTHRVKPVGTYHVHRKTKMLVPDRCPSCSSQCVEHDSGRIWICWECSWYGEVNSKTWTRSDLTPDAKRGTEPHPAGRAVPRRATLGRSLAS